MHKFIYVFSKEDRDALLSLGYKQMNTDDSSASYYIFENCEEMKFAKFNGSCFYSDNLNF